MIQTKKKRYNFKESGTSHERWEEIRMKAFKIPIYFLNFLASITFKIRKVSTLFFIGKRNIVSGKVSLKAIKMLLI